MARHIVNSKMEKIIRSYIGHELENKNKVHIVYDTPEADTLQEDDAKNQKSRK